MGQNIRNFGNIDRVEENPEGYVIIEDDKGKEIKISGKVTLTKIADLTSSECSNIFIVRNSNLSISRDIAQESEFYTNVTDRLTGLRTKEIQKIKEILREIGKITPTGMFRDIKDEKLKMRIGKCKKLIGKIEDLSEKIDEAEEESAKLRQEIKRIELELERLEEARKREKYKKGKEALNKLKEHLEKLKNLEIYNEEDEQLWRDCERDIKTHSKEKERLFSELQKNKEKLKKINTKLSEVERDFRMFEDRKKEIDEKIKPELKNYKENSEKLAQQETKNKFFTSAGIISAILLGISLFGVLFNSSLLFYSMMTLFLISGIVSGIFKYNFVRNKALLAGVFENIRLTLSKFKMDAENFEEISSNIQKFDEEYRKKQNELQELKRIKENLEEKIKELRDEEIPEIEKKIKEAEKGIDQIKIRSGEESLKGYSKKLKSKKDHGKSRDEQKSILESLLGKKKQKLEENIPYWNKEIKKLEEYKDKAKDIEYSEDNKSKLKEKKQQVERKLETLKESMESIQKELEDVEREANEILRLEDEYLYCKTSVDLKAIKDNLQRFIEENESNKDNILEAIKIFEEIEKEEREKVSELFGKDSSISKYFNEITDGLYNEVVFNQEIGKIEVKRRDGKIIEAEKLSGGAYDQLYFSIRISLGEKLLKGKKGFFIMDDPFIKADPDRLKRQIKMLRRIAELGWQIIYFSAKGEIKKILEKDIKTKKVNYVEIHGMFS